MATLEQTTPQTLDVEAIVRERLKESPVSVEEIIALLSGNRIASSRRRAKEIAWKMVEQGKARFNDKWLLEIKQQSTT